MPANASSSSTSPASPLTPTAPTRRPSPNAATPPRKKLNSGSKLASSVARAAGLLGELPRRERVAAGGGVRLAAGVEVRVARGARHRDRGDDLAVGVDDDDRDRPGRGLEHGGDDGEGLVVGHFVEKKGARAPSRKGCESTARPPENGNCNATRTTSAKPTTTAIAPAPIAWKAELFEPTRVA